MPLFLSTASHFINVLNTDRPVLASSTADPPAHPTNQPHLSVYHWLLDLCRYALNTLMNVFSAQQLPSGLKQETLSGLVRTLLLRLVDDNLGKQPEGEALLKVSE